MVVIPPRYKTFTLLIKLTLVLSNSLIFDLTIFGITFWIILGDFETILISSKVDTVFNNENSPSYAGDMFLSVAPWTAINIFFVCSFLLSPLLLGPLILQFSSKQVGDSFRFLARLGVTNWPLSGKLAFELSSWKFTQLIYLSISQIIFFYLILKLH